jgi:hypothetical protein
MSLEKLFMKESKESWLIGPGFGLPLKGAVLKPHKLKVSKVI